ncbi:MAG: hypothetical protein OXL68_03980 [Paracoccaceae bacterium]|nr:hypothetical protein [Paracoccaceae bacterium]
MQINPGGRLDIKDVIGRDDEIDRYWQVLERQGLIISAERRIGKTHFVLKMRDECRTGYLPYYQDLEAVHSIADLIRSIYGTVQQSSTTSSKVKAFIGKWSGWFPNRVAGIDLPKTDDTWKDLISNVFADLIQIAGDQRIVMLWDEFPLMLHNLQRSVGPDSAMQLLDHLCAIRLAHADKMRFLFTGSIGLHLVLRSLHTAGHANQPVNDMMSLTVPPMAHRKTCELAKALLEGTRANPAQIPDLAELIANEVGGFPYYVHHVVDQLDQMPHPPSLQDVSVAVDTLVYAPHDPANLGHYAARMSTYYSDNERSRALTVLDTIAGLASPIPVPELLNLCRYREPSLSIEQFRDVLTILAEDHYIEPRKYNGLKTYDFRWQLGKRWWKETRL